MEPFERPIQKNFLKNNLLPGNPLDHTIDQTTVSPHHFYMKQPKAKELVVGQNPESIDPSRKEIIFWEEGNPRCVVNLLRNAETFRQKVLAIPPNLLSMSDYELEKHVEPSQVDNDLRQAFWDEYTAAIDTDSVMRVTAIYSRVCTKEFFHKISQSPDRLAYILRPPREYTLRMKSNLVNRPWQHGK